MKKLFIGLLIVVLISFLPGCASSSNNNEGLDNDKKTEIVENVDTVEYVENAEFVSGDVEGLYTGESLNGLPNGNGTLIVTNAESDNWTYSGEWKDGFPSGIGRMEWEDGFAYEGEFVDGEVFGVTKCYQYEDLLYFAEIEGGQLVRLVREKVELPENDPVQYVHVGEIGFAIPQTWTYEIIDERTVYINIPEQENVKVIFSANEELDLNQEVIREEIKSNYINKYENEYVQYSVVEDDFEIEVVEKYNLHISFYSNDLKNPITDVYSKSFMRGYEPITYTITTIQDGGFYDYSETVLCIENTLKNWDAIEEDITEAIRKEGIEYVKQMLEGNVDWEELEKYVPKILGQDVVGYTYKEQAVIVEGVIDNITDKAFDVWIPYNETYMKLDDWRYDISNENIVDGMTIQMCVETHVDGSLNSMDGIFKIRKMDVPIIEDIVNEFKSTCESIDYKSIMRNPDKSFGTVWKATGTVLQVIDTKDYLQELLLVLDDGNIVYVVYHKENDADNVLENDRISVYGTFYMTETYITVWGDSKTVPRLNVDYIDIK